MMSKTLVVMQPTVLPWAGYFNLLHIADDFVFYDDVQLEKRSWQTRNRLLLEGKTDWITVPVEHAGLNQKIFETRVILTPYWINNTRKIFTRNYAKHPFFNEAAEVLNFFLEFENNNLSNRNEATIRFVAERLKLQTRIHRASELGLEGVRSDRLIEFCKYFEADIYLSPLGASGYLEADGFAQRAPSRLMFQNYIVQRYPQANSKEFVPNLSIIDVIANLGWEETRSYVVGNHKN